MFEEIIASTIDYYNNNDENYIPISMSYDLHDEQNRFLQYVKTGGRILDLGCGPGRDSKIFKQLGYDVIGYDGSYKMVDYTRKHVGIEVVLGDIRSIEFLNSFDGIWASASLLHIPKTMLTETFKNIYLALRSDSAWFMSFKHGDKAKFTKKGRLFTFMDEKLMRNLISNFNGLKIKEEWLTKDPRPQRSNEFWYKCIIRKQV